MSDLLQDVDEMMRQERLMAIWQRHGNTIIGGILAVILAVALQQGYQAWFLAHAQKQTAELVAAAENPEQLSDFLSRHEKGTLAGFARLIAAQKKLEASDSIGAAKLYLALRNDARATRDLRDLGTLLWVRTVSADEKIKPQDLRSALAPLMRDEGQPFFWSAKIETALIHAEREGDFSSAIALLTPMAGHPSLPATQRDRVEILLHLYRLRQAEIKTQEESK